MGFLKFDTLKEYHIQAAHGRIKHLTENIVALLADNNTEDKSNLYHLIEKLLSELNFLKKCYVNSSLAEQLELDIEEANYLIEQLKGSYTIDDPISWIKGFIDKNSKQKNQSKVKKSELMRGLDAIVQAEDTAEERKLKERKSKANRLPIA